MKTKKDFILAGWKWRETRRNQFGSIRVVLKKDVVTVIWLLVVCIKQPSRQGNYHYPIGYWRSSGLIKTSFFSLSLSNQRVVVFFYVQMLTETFYKIPSLHLVGMNLSRKLSWPDPSRFLFSFWSPMNWLTFLFILVVLLAVFGEIVIHFGETRWQLRAQIKKGEYINSNLRLLFMKWNQINSESTAAWNYITTFGGRHFIPWRKKQERIFKKLSYSTLTWEMINHRHVSPVVVMVVVVVVASPSE